MGEILYLFVFNLFLLGITNIHGALYPFPSETRQVQNLDGLWKFLKSDPFNPSEGIDGMWFKKRLEDVGNPIDMPVPGSFNDVTSNRSIRDHAGLVWYQRKFFVPHYWGDNGLVWIRFGSVHYEAKVWINGEKVAEHSIGHLPFEAEISKQLNFTGENQITVSVDNRLSSVTIPQGGIKEIDTENGKQKTLDYGFDFFNYAGIHRSVHLVHTPETYIEDVDLLTEMDAEGNVSLKYKISSNGTAVEGLHASVSIFNRNGTKVAAGTTDKLSEFHSISVPNTQLWWPYLMDPIAGYMYNIEIRLKTHTMSAVDVYRMKYGFRVLRWNKERFMINEKQIYFRGFGKHEDSDIRGRGLDYPLLAKDFDLLRWIGANSYRTSHYPYSEESMQLADEYGMMVIDECSSVKTGGFHDKNLLANHISSLAQLIKRDKNHPSVVMWSIANEPNSDHADADSYFKEIANFTRSLDPSRAVTAALSTQNIGNDHAAKYVDIINFNRYNGWYRSPGKPEAIPNAVVREALNWYNIFKKPIIIGEYGADTMEGMHGLPEFIWSEEYQRDVFSGHFKAFDRLRKMDFFIGEFIWNFADFKTKQGYTRVGGNKKGVFQRNRQPKSSAYLVRNRYHSLARSDRLSYNLPDDIIPYVID